MARRALCLFAACALALAGHAVADADGLGKGLDMGKGLWGKGKADWGPGVKRVTITSLGKASYPPAPSDYSPGQ